MPMSKTNNVEFNVQRLKPIKSAPKPKANVKKAKKVENIEPERPNYLRSPACRQEILKTYGRRVARIIGDAVKGDVIVASVSWYRVSTDELAAMYDAEIITGGFSHGQRDSSPIVCNV